MSEFYEADLSLESLWRAIILFGRNVASYKFALGKSLLELAVVEKNFITLDELAIPFSKYISGHLKLVAKQGTFPSSRFLEACRKFNEGEISTEDLRSITVRLGFNNVIDAFHVIGPGDTPKRFFVDHRRAQRGITLTDELLRLKERVQFANLPKELEARWRLVETAWSIGVAPKLLQVQHDSDLGLFFTALDQNRRTNITSAKDALNGYQKGKCFYCFSDIEIAGGKDRLCEIDHFFPYSLQRKWNLSVNLDGVWNLVLACSRCNRGVGGKFESIPALRYLDRLFKRNDYLIDSHHPLRETLMDQCGNTYELRRKFLQKHYSEAKAILIHNWAADQESDSAF